MIICFDTELVKVWRKEDITKMLVIDRYGDGSFMPIYYERKHLFTYLSQQVKSLSHLEDISSFHIEWGMPCELEIPKNVKISRFIRNRLKVFSCDSYSIVMIPCVLLQISVESKVLGSNDIMFKEIITYYASLERRLLKLMEKSKECRI